MEKNERPSFFASQKIDLSKEQVTQLVQTLFSEKDVLVAISCFARIIASDHFLAVQNLNNPQNRIIFDQMMSVIGKLYSGSTPELCAMLDEPLNRAGVFMMKDEKEFAVQVTQHIIQNAIKKGTTNETKS